MKKKILIVTECFYPEEFKINDVAFSWVDKGYTVDVLTLSPTYPIGKVFSGYKNKFPYIKESLNGLNIYRVYAITGYRENSFKKVLRFINFMILGTFVAILIGRKYDYIFGFNAGALTSMIPAKIAGKLYKKPLMFWVQDVWPESLYAFGLKKNKLISCLLDFFVGFAHKNITSIAISSKGFEAELKRYVNSSVKFYYLPNWADDLDQSLSPAILSENKLTHFTFAGNIGKQQNLENIINAFVSMEDRYLEKSQLNVIGDGPKLEDLKTLSGGNPNIVFYGKQKREIMSTFYKASDFLIVSLVNEPIFSLTVPAKTQTYVAAKKPLLAIINGDTANFVKQYNLGLCAHPSDIKEITHLFKKCIDTNSEQRKEFTNENSTLLNSLFNKEKTINELLNILVSK